MCRYTWECFDVEPYPPSTRSVAELHMAKRGLSTLIGQRGSFRMCLSCSHAAQVTVEHQCTLEYFLNFQTGLMKTNQRV